MKRLIIAIAAVAALGAPAIEACTSMVASARATASGKPLLWKHRDSSGDMNFVARTAPTDSTYGFSALYNGGDSLLADAWAGVNEAGFAIMNTASYNLAPDTAQLRDREGAVMALARRPVHTAHGVLIRTNFSVSGAEGKGMGYIRCRNAEHLAGDAIARGELSPVLLTEGLSRSFYHDLLGRDCSADTNLRWVVDQDFIPRRSSVASVVVEGCKPGANPSDAVMWTVIGYPAAGHVVPATATNVPAELLPTEPGYTSPAAVANAILVKKIFPIEAGSGQRYIDMDALRPIMAEQHRLSMKAYQSNQ